jgi:C4-dicarboxylate-specific signal transduction histidine kinase
MNTGALTPCPRSTCRGATPGEKPWIVGDRRRLERVVVNLLDNARRHGEGVVRLGITRHDGRARIEVDDAGPAASTCSSGSPGVVTTSRTTPPPG